MRATLLTTTVLAVLTLSACSKPADRAADAQAPSAAADSGGPPAAGSAHRAAAPAVRAAALAYAYAADLIVPAGRIEGLQAQHQAACIVAGPGLCQVTGSTYESRGHDDIHATLSLRGDPGWVAAFRRNLGPDAAAAGGRIGHAALTSEDLARQVVDTQAAIRAKVALRDRLQHELETRPGKPKDFTAEATDLAGVQGDLDATSSELAAMRERLATSTLAIDYDSKPGFAGEGDAAPIGAAVRGVVGILSGTLAFMITAGAVITPWALLIGAGIWIARLPRFRRKPAAPPAP